MGKLLLSYTDRQKRLDLCNEIDREVSSTEEWIFSQIYNTHILSQTHLYSNLFVYHYPKIISLMPSISKVTNWVMITMKVNENNLTS